MANQPPAQHCLGDTHLRWQHSPSVTDPGSPSVSESCMFHMEDLTPELDRIQLAGAACSCTHACSFPDFTARQLRATRITVSVEGRPGGLLAFQKDRISVGSAAFDDITLTREQAFPSAFSVTRFDDFFEVHNEDDEDIYVNGMRLPFATRVCTAPGAAVIVTGGMRDNFSLTLRVVVSQEV